MRASLSNREWVTLYGLYVKVAMTAANSLTNETSGTERPCVSPSNILGNFGICTAACSGRVTWSNGEENRDEKVERFASSRTEDRWTCRGCTTLGDDLRWRWCRKNETTGGIRHCEDLVLLRHGVMSPHPSRVERRVTTPSTKSSLHVCPKSPESRRSPSFRRSSATGTVEIRPFPIYT